jgi:hypothetical protein
MDGFCSALGSCFTADFLFATFAAPELGFINIRTGSFGLSFGSRLTMGFFCIGCEPNVPFGVEEVEAFAEDGSCLKDRFGGAFSTTLSNSRSSSALRSRLLSCSFFIGDTGAEGVAEAAIYGT